jgi:hypothetical protein
MEQFLILNYALEFRPGLVAHRLVHRGAHFPHVVVQRPGPELGEKDADDPFLRVDPKCRRRGTHPVEFTCIGPPRRHTVEETQQSSS